MNFIILLIIVKYVEKRKKRIKNWKVKWKEIAKEIVKIY